MSQALAKHSVTSRRGFNSQQPEGIRPPKSPVDRIGTFQAPFSSVWTEPHREIYTGDLDSVPV